MHRASTLDLVRTTEIEKTKVSYLFKNLSQCSIIKDVSSKMHHKQCSLNAQSVNIRLPNRVLYVFADTSLLNIEKSC